jgi:hypothetical protein
MYNIDHSPVVYFRDWDAFDGNGHWSWYGLYAVVSDTRLRRTIILAITPRYLPQRATLITGFSIVQYTYLAILKIAGSLFRISE